MTALSANCPSCGAPISFKSGSSIVLICSYCRSVVARTDRALEDLGRVAELAETGSPLQVGLRGQWRGVSFELTGRAQMGHEAGGVWDEWYATFTNGQTGWLAEAQGRFYLTFKQQVDPNVIPPLENLALGAELSLVPSSGPLVVAEKGKAQTLGASGEIPYKLVPGETFYYADLSGAAGVFGTIDYSDDMPQLYVGQEVTLAEIGLADARAPEREARQVSAVSLPCPNCGGPLELRAPDKAERVSCPNCNGLLDVNQGQLSYLKSLGDKRYTPYIPTGATAEFEGTNFTALGFLVRSVEIEGYTYLWTEYLLYNPQVGFRWLVHSDNHWNFVKAVPPGEVRDLGSHAQYRGQKFKIFQDAPARVEHVAGEFYWKVEVGEKVSATDYVHAPEMLSREITSNRENGGSGVWTGEINWSLGTYLPVKEVERKFNITLPSPTNVAPNQPFPLKGIYAYWGILLLLLCTVGFGSLIASGSNDVITQTVQFPPLPNPQATQVVFSDPFELRGDRNIRIEAQSPVSNSWMYAAGDLINEETGLVQTFDLPIEAYAGVEDGESWSEGGQNKSTTLSALPGGQYTLRLEAQWGDQWAQPANLNVNIRQGHATGFNFIVALIVISVVPILVGIWHWKFESRRWSESMFGGGSDSESDDDDE
ncbi:MAG: DUF4178 domain-containing protein [Pyrinomonadaceae bacterium]